MKKIKKWKIILLSTVIAIASIFLLSFVLSIFISLLSGDSIQDRMKDYYSENSNYKELNGTIKSSKNLKTFDQLVIEIELMSPNADFPSDIDTGLNTFCLVNWSKQDFNLEVGDIIAFTSAPKVFSKGHILPILSLEKEENMLLSLEQGKENYLGWIEISFRFPVTYIVLKNYN